MLRKNKKPSERILRLREILSACHVDGLIFFNMNNIRYLSGFTGSEGILLITFGRMVLLIDGRYTSQAALETKNVLIMECPDKFEGIGQVIKKFRLKRVGLEADSLTLAAFERLTNYAKKGTFVALTDELRLLRACKDENEIAVMKKAAEISSRSVKTLVAQMECGLTEKELAWRLEVNARSLGAEGIAFETIVAAGENSCMPHARPTDRKIKKGDFIVIDFGVRYRGYCSDETCTVAFGKLTDRQKNAYQMVKNAHDLVISGLKAGMHAAEADRLARGAFGKKYGRYFVHGTGHGVGLEIHEAPRLAPASGDVLQPGMVVTVEPGLYFPGLWGIRIEDTVLVKKNSCEKLTKMDKELIVI